MEDLKNVKGISNVCLREDAIKVPWFPRVLSDVNSYGQELL